MRPERIEANEKTFLSKLTTKDGTKFTLGGITDIGNGVTIHSIRPDYSTYYYKSNTTKKSICLHFTVGYIHSDIAALTKENNHVSVSYVVDRSGNIYELFPDTYWSYHLGNGAVGGNRVMSSSSIGIEISNYGPLTLSGTTLKDVYKKEYCKKDEICYYSEHEYRGNKYYATMSDKQIESLSALIQYLSKKHDIPLSFKGDDNLFESADEATSFSGIFYHTNVRKDKFDWPYYDSIKRVIAKACMNKDAVSSKDEVEPAVETPVGEPVVEKVVENVAETSVETTKETVKSTIDSTVESEKSETESEENQSFIRRLLNRIIKIFKK